MLWACALDIGGRWDDHLYLVEFAYNKSYQTTIQMAPFEALYGQKYTLPLHWDEVGERVLLRLDFVQQAVDTIQLVN